MAEALHKGMALSFRTNAHAALVFTGSQELQRFTECTSVRLASLLHILKHAHPQTDDGFMADMLDMANDLAYQVQQAVELVGSGVETEVTHG
jgi:hypothetical protein